MSEFFEQSIPARAFRASRQVPKIWANKTLANKTLVLSAAASALLGIAADIECLCHLRVHVVPDGSGLRHRDRLLR